MGRQVTTQHPWRVVETDPRTPPAFVSLVGAEGSAPNGGSWAIAEFCGPNRVADAQLAALAPELVEALRECVSQCADFENMTEECAASFRAARAILARIDGGK